MFRTRLGVGLRAGVAGLTVAFLAVSAGGADDPARTIRDSFETPATVWQQEQTDAVINLFAHDRSGRARHEGQLAEHFQFGASPGSSFFYSYRLPRVTVTRELHASLFVRASRAGVRIFGRVILPGDTDPESGEPSFVLVPGTIYDNVDRWQRIELSTMLPSIESQARVLRASTRRPVSVAGAYLDRVVVNLYCGPGDTEVFLDELQVAPVPPEAVTAHTRPAAVEVDDLNPTPGPAPAAGAGPAPRVALDFKRNRLKRNGADWVITAIEAPGANLGELQKVGCDVLAENVNADPRRLREAVERGFLLAPGLVDDAGEPLDPAQALAAAAAFPLREAVAFWNLGEDLGAPDNLADRKRQLDSVRATKSGFRGLPRDFSHLTSGIVVDNFNLFSQAPRHLDILGVQPACWGTIQKPLDTYTYLKQRRDLGARGNPEGLFLAWLPAAPPPALQRNVWGEDSPPSWGYPVIQPEQLRLYTYIALSAGYRGIGFRSNADLTRTDLGKMLLIEMALLNEEIDIFEAILAQGKDPIPLYQTMPSDPPAMPPPGSVNVNARVQAQKEPDPNPWTRVASIDTLDRKTSLLLVSDFFEWAAYQPNQMAMNDLKLMVPARESAQAWLISPGGVEPLERDRPPGGVRFNVPDYGPTALVLVTTDPALPERIRVEVERMRPLAVQLAIEQAQIQLKWVSEINGRLLADGHPLYDPTDPKAYKLPPNMSAPNDEAALLAKSDELIKSAIEALEREDYAVAWAEARRATRPLRILMFAHWLNAFTKMVKIAAPYPEDLPERRLPLNNRNQQPKKPKLPPRPIVLPITCPPLLSFNLLPQHYIWLDWMRSRFSRNLVPSGSFDEYKTFAALEAAGWADESRPMPEITPTIETIPSTQDKKKRILKMTVWPTDEKMIDHLPSYLDLPIAAVRSPEVPVKAGQFLRISVDLSKPIYHGPGHGGIIVRDSIGGEPLQFRFSDVPIELTPVVLYRRAPADGVVTVMLGLAGYGEVYFNNFRIEVAEGPGGGNDGAAPAPPDLAGAAPPLPDPAARPRRPAGTPAAAAPGNAARPVPVPRINR